MPYSLDGQPLAVSREPQLKDGTLWIPLRAIGEAVGGNVDWDSDNQVAVLYLNSRMVTLKIGDTTADTDGEKAELQAAPYLDNGETWVPVRLFNEALGYGIAVDLGSSQVDLTSPVV
ncbi:MAG TPA: copper amine oxidase N-terminal domain-containing protein [Abditibacteriaceae bacterium]|nr:copper amine oxidase N-terminal domain-containing protein [Abditibacteriaceae bacterium]